MVADEMHSLFADMYTHVLQAHPLQRKLDAHCLGDTGTSSDRSCLVLDDLDRAIGLFAQEVASAGQAQ
ncbi:hypothetical protein MHAS44199_21725 [Mycolicibacterium hassiacum DSM 44199]|nr:hypothetical protein [Mycolicibacterium hassiacum DSM 44199]